MLEECPECCGSGYQKCSCCGAPDSEDCVYCDGVGSYDENEDEDDD